LRTSPVVLAADFFVAPRLWLARGVTFFRSPQCAEVLLSRFAIFTSFVQSA
jgi:hypothetical protein